LASHIEGPSLGVSANAVNAIAANIITAVDTKFFAYIIYQFH
jgi:hypothetical protein